MHAVSTNSNLLEILIRLKSDNITLQSIMIIVTENVVKMTHKNPAVMVLSYCYLD